MKETKWRKWRWCASCRVLVLSDRHEQENPSHTMGYRTVTVERYRELERQQAHVEYLRTLPEMRIYDPYKSGRGEG